MSSSTRITAKAEIRQFKEKLDSYREEALAFLQRVDEERQNLDNNRPSEVGDFCVQTASREYLFERSSQQRQLLRKVEAALRRIESGTFGECVACGDEINRKRLAAMPWTEFCLHCQEEREQWTRTPHLVQDGGRNDGPMR